MGKTPFTLSLAYICIYLKLKKVFLNLLKVG